MAGFQLRMGVFVAATLLLVCTTHVRLGAAVIGGGNNATNERARRITRWPRGSTHPCGTLHSPGASHGMRSDETDHCFPASASDHMVCCVDIQDVGNARNQHDASVAGYNPLEGPITRNSDPSSYSWCTCSELICTQQLRGRVAWVGQPGDQIEWHMEPPEWYFEDPAGQSNPESQSSSHYRHEGLADGHSFF